MVKFFTWIDAGIKKLHWFDISLIKTSVFAFTLLLAKLFPMLLSLNWYWYLIIAFLATIRPAYIILKG